MLHPSLQQAAVFSGTGAYDRVPVYRELFMDMFTPMQVLRMLKRVSRHTFLLESAEQSQKWGRYTFLGYDPQLVVTCRNGVLKIDSGTAFSTDRETPQQVIRRILSQNRAPRLEGLPPFTGGLVGYFGYDYIKYTEPVLKPVLEAEPQGMPQEKEPETAVGEVFNDLDLMLFEKIIAFDHYRQKIFLIKNIRLDDLQTEYSRAEMELDSLADLLKAGRYAEAQPLTLKSPFRALFSREAFCGMVDRAKRYIREGDIFQVVLSNRLEAEMSGSLLDAYRILRTANPSPYMFYFSGSDLEIAGASPETLVKVEGETVHTFPLAGTRRRGATEEEDLALEKELLADEKERAEHNMLVDLGRNDVGKVSRFGSVEVERYMEIERFSHVMHIGSVVKGLLKENKDALDALDAILPAGTLSGAPKIRACQIIQELEQAKRGIYGGAIGYLDFSGNLDTCIAIRIAYAKEGKVFVRSGAGIVADSVPENEYQECLNKAAAVLEALKAAQGGEIG